jgi:hypothetical protein
LGEESDFVIKNINFNKDELFIDKTPMAAANPLGDCIFVISSSRRSRISKNNYLKCSSLAKIPLNALMPKFVIYTIFKISAQKITIRHNIYPEVDLRGLKSVFPKSPKIKIFKFIFCTFFFNFKVDYKLIVRKTTC